MSARIVFDFASLRARYVALLDFSRLYEETRDLPRGARGNGGREIRKNNIRGRGSGFSYFRTSAVTRERY